MKVFHFIVYILLAGGLTNCVPREQVTLRTINIREVTTGSDGNPVLHADAVFFNPNTSRMRLKRISVDVLLDGKKTARVDQQLNTLIKASAEFTIPLEIQLHMKEAGLLDTLFSLFGKSSHDIQFSGSMKVIVNGFPVRFPMEYREKIKF
jgi:hypothetical protein